MSQISGPLGGQASRLGSLVLPQAVPVLEGCLRTYKKFTTPFKVRRNRLGIPSPDWEAAGLERTSELRHLQDPACHRDLAHHCTSAAGM